jgi:transposase
MEITTIGLDLAKSVFQVHGLDKAGQVVVRKRLRRSEMRAYFAALPGCLIGMEACATAHFWARELKALGHDVKLLPPAYVKAYVKRGKNDALDAEAICEAVQRPSMRFVPMKSAEQQAALVLHRVRAQLVRERTKFSNMLRAHMAEFGLIAPKTMAKLSDLMGIVADETDARLPRIARIALREVVGELDALKRRIAVIDTEILAWHRADATSTRLAGIPGVGPIVASAIAASVPDPSGFRSGRHFAAWLGLTPKDHSTGGKQRLGKISKMGDRYLRSLLVLGATSVVGHAQRRRSPADAWVLKLLTRRPPRLVTVALANKMARIAWALMAHGDTYRLPKTVA